MQDFSGKYAVVTGGGSGIGRELVRQLSAEGCHVAMCDVSADNMAETRDICEAGASGVARILVFVADVSEEEQILAFRETVATDFSTDHIHLLFNNAGIAGGNSFVEGNRQKWEKTFNVCWGGVYFGVRAFLPMLIAAQEAHIVNMSSLNGFWASIGPKRAHTAYSAAKFAVKGFSEALINDLAASAQHVKCSVVMPGHIGTNILSNTRKIGSGKTDTGSLDHVRAERMAFAQQQFIQNAPTSAVQAAAEILQGVRSEKWRILIGDDARILDQMVREAPEKAYDDDFYLDYQSRTGFSV